MRVAGRLTIAAAGLLEVEPSARLVATSITAAGDDFVNLGQVRADGASGGAIRITARDYLNAGTVSAAGTAGAGGVVQVAVSQSYIDTAAALTTARGTGAGGAVVVDAGSSGRLFSSGHFDATGASGGGIDLLGKDVLLVGATLDRKSVV